MTQKTYAGHSPRIIASYFEDATEVCICYQFLIGVNIEGASHKCILMIACDSYPKAVIGGFILAAAELR